MNQDASQLLCSSSLEHSSHFISIADSIAQIKAFALQEFDREVAQKQLYYHNRDHIHNVQRRANQIFEAIYPPDAAADADVELSRTKLLLDLCIVAHDMVQVFAPKTQPHTARHRETGVSETATLDRLLAYIHQLNQQVSDGARLNEKDIATIREAIIATICTYDPTDQAIYQPALYEANQSRSIVARILAWADIGALGIDGIEGYNQEGALLFLEENLDIIPLLREGTIYQLKSHDPALHENARQRLLRRCRFQVSFARSRVARFKQEVASLPEDAASRRTHQIFRHLNSTTIQEIEATTPTSEDTSLETFLQFFEFERYVGRS